MFSLILSLVALLGTPKSDSKASAPKNQKPITTQPKSASTTPTSAPELSGTGLLHGARVPPTP